MGYPIRSIQQFEADLTNYKKNWAIVILANAHSYSRAVKFILLNFHIMDRISDDVNFYLPGYCMSHNRNNFIKPDKWMDIELNQAHSDFHNTKETETSPQRNSNNSTSIGYSIIDSPRLGEIYFSEADYADFIMEFTRKKNNYFYSGACELILIPIVQGRADYLASRVYDLDAVIECRGGNSIDFFLHSLFQIIRYGSPFNIGNRLLNILLFRPVDVIRKIETLYRESVSQMSVDDKYGSVVNQVVKDIEKKVHWSLKEDFYFISYSTQNIMLAECLKLELQKRRKNVWIAPDGIPQGREYSLVIPTALRLAKTFILLLTPDSAKSHWVKRELDIAIGNEVQTQIKVVLAGGFTIEDIRNDPELYFYLNRVQVRYQYDDIMKNQKLFTSFLED